MACLFTTTELYRNSCTDLNADSELNPVDNVQPSPEMNESPVELARIRDLLGNGRSRQSLSFVCMVYIQYNLLNSSNKRACSNKFVSVTIVSSN